MPVIDMPLEELYTYQGRNPKPADFDEYWERALAELDAIEADVKDEEAAFQFPFASCRHLTFTGVRGARIHVQAVIPHQPPAGSEKLPAVLEFHGYGMNAGDWTTKAALAAAGHAVFSMDIRGQGGLSEDAGGVSGNTLQGHITRGMQDGEDELLFRHIFLDTVQLARLVMARDDIDEINVSVTGWSQGGALTIACAALEPRVRRAAPVYPFLSDYLRVWEMDLDVEAYQDVRRYFRRFDPTHNSRDAFFERLGYIDIQHLADRIQAPVLMGTGLIDPVCPPSTQFAAYNKITSEKEIVLYPDFAHEALPGMRDRIFTFLTAT
ncbi:alpha/beta fold hydrolase [Bacillus daqingensis]|uniref:Alpha/beta fold hydrolase n=1 Tax=Bacillus daqingensis TaxID=872396 RepID=A0ABV9NUB0_9BACI